NFPNLNSLSLANCIISDKTAQKLAQLTNLKSLNLKGCKLITNFDFLKSLTKLEDLSVESCDGFTPPSLKNCLLPFLKCLNISHTPIQMVKNEENCLEKLEELD